MKKYVLLLAFTSACASTPCREPQATTHVFVAKSDGAKQCEGKGIAPEKMEADLKDIKVFSKSNQSDGLMRTAVCGASSGRFNVFEIEAKDLEKAKTLGFKEWKPEQ